MDRVRPLNRAPRPSASPSAKAKTERSSISSHERASCIALAVSFGPGNVPPTEFRIFIAGWNDTENGRFLFDEAAAKATMAAYAKWGVDLAIDLEHQMLVEEIAPDPTAKDARGWCGLELRPDGSLWAVNVTWTPDGAARLTDKRQRYVSPAFGYDTETSRVTQMINVAITAMPATHDTPALMAASKAIAATSTHEGSTIMANGLSPKLLAAVLDALSSKDNKGPAADVLRQVLVSVMSDGEAPDPEDAPPPLGDGGADDATEADPAAMAASRMLPAEKVEEVAAASARLMRLSGKTSLVEALAETETWRTSHLELETERQKLATERSTLESAERRKLCVELVTLGAEFPGTVWTDEKSTALKPRWLKMELSELRSHVAEQRGARGGKAALGVRPPAGVATGEHGLTPSQLEHCRVTGCEPATFARLKAGRTNTGV